MRPTCSTYRVPDQPGLYNDTLAGKNNTLASDQAMGCSRLLSFMEKEVVSPSGTVIDHKAEAE